MRARKFEQRVCQRCSCTFRTRSDSATRHCSIKCFQGPVTHRLFGRTRTNAAGCLVWTGPLCGRYPAVRFNGRSMKGNRVAWILKHGDIPIGMNVLHKCDNTRCVNVEHLFLGTQLDNVRDMVSKNRAFFSGIVLHDGTRIPLKQACDWLGVKTGAVRQRINKLGWTPGRAMAAPPNTKGLHAYSHR